MKGPKREKPKKGQKPLSRKGVTRRVVSGTNSYLANYDSRKERKKMNQSNASSKRNRKMREADDVESQGSEVLGTTGSDFLKDSETMQVKSSFFKKKEAKGKVHVESPTEGTHLRVWPGMPPAKGEFFSKTDDLKFLKEISKKKSKFRRGSSAYTKENSRKIQSNHESQRRAVHPEEGKSERGERGEEDDRRKLSKMSNSLVMGQRSFEVKGNEEGEGQRDTKREIQLIKQKYLGKSAKVGIQ